MQIIKQTIPEHVTEVYDRGLTRLQNKYLGTAAPIVLLKKKLNTALKEAERQYNQAVEEETATKKSVLERQAWKTARRIAEEYRGELNRAKLRVTSVIQKTQTVFDMLRDRVRTTDGLLRAQVFQKHQQGREKEWQQLILETDLVIHGHMEGLRSSLVRLSSVLQETPRPQIVTRDAVERLDQGLEEMEKVLSTMGRPTP